MLVVVVDFRAFRVMVGLFQVMRREVAVRHRVFVLVPGLGLVNVLRREGRRERQERRDQTSRRGAGQSTRNHEWHY